MEQYDVLGLIVLAAGLSTLVSATIGVTSGWLGGSIPASTYEDAWGTWWLGDALGDLVVAPLLFVWSRRGRVVLPRCWIAEAIVLLVAVGVLSLVVFDILAPALPLPRYLVFPALIWVALRLGPPGSVTALALVSASAIWGTAQGHRRQDRLYIVEKMFLLSLNLLALLFHTVLEWSDDKYALLRHVLARRQTFCHDIQALMRYMVFDHWDHLMDFMIRGLELESKLKPKLDTS